MKGKSREGGTERLIFGINKVNQKKEKEAKREEKKISPIRMGKEYLKGEKCLFSVEK